MKTNGRGSRTIRNKINGHPIYYFDDENCLMAVEAAITKGISLHLARLRFFDLHGANMKGADLREADLSHTNLDGADLSGADLTGADFTSASMHGTRLDGANLRGATMTEVRK